METTETQANPTNANAREIVETNAGTAEPIVPQPNPAPEGFQTVNNRDTVGMLLLAAGIFDPNDPNPLQNPDPYSKANVRLTGLTALRNVARVIAHYDDNPANPVVQAAARKALIVGTRIPIIGATFMLPGAYNRAANKFLKVLKEVDPGSAAYFEAKPRLLADFLKDHKNARELVVNAKNNTGDCLRDLVVESGYLGPDRDKARETYAFYDSLVYTSRVTALGHGLAETIQSLRQQPDSRAEELFGFLDDPKRKLVKDIPADNAERLKEYPPSLRGVRDVAGTLLGARLKEILNTPGLTKEDKIIRLEVFQKQCAEVAIASAKAMAASNANDTTGKFKALLANGYAPLMEKPSRSLDEITTEISGTMIADKVFNREIQLPTIINALQQAGHNQFQQTLEHLAESLTLTSFGGQDASIKAYIQTIQSVTDPLNIAPQALGKAVAQALYKDIVAQPEVQQILHQKRQEHMRVQEQEKAREFEAKHREEAVGKTGAMPEGITPADHQLPAGQQMTIPNPALQPAALPNGMMPPEGPQLTIPNPEVPRGIYPKGNSHAKAIAAESDTPAVPQLS